MGLFYRKSSKAGPFRVTASKSGISYSAGVKGIRVTKRANGRVQTSVSAPGTGLRYTTSSGKRQSVPAATNATTADRHPVVHRERRKRCPGVWYFVILLVSAGLLTAIPFAHAASRLHRKEFRLRAGIYAVLAVALSVLASVTPQDAQGNAVGTAGHVLSTIVGFGAIAVMVVGCYQLAAVRREVYGIAAEPMWMAGPAAADPVVAARLAARARRSEARALAQSDPVLAQDLRIGRPDLPRQYDDGGLVDLNSAPAQVITAACCVDPVVAERIVAAREKLGSFSSLDEMFVFAEIEEGPAARIREYAVLLPR